MVRGNLSRLVGEIEQHPIKLTFVLRKFVAFSTEFNFLQLFQLVPGNSQNAASQPGMNGFV